MTEVDLPANPMSIELTITHRRWWWQTNEEDHSPEHWEVSADIGDLDLCRFEHRHVADISLAVADLHRDKHLMDSLVLGEWALEFIAETVVDLADGQLHPELDALISPGPPRMVILRQFELAEPWRGCGLGSALVAAALDAFSATARLAVCRISPADFMPQTKDRVSAEFASVRMGALLERVGFRIWRGVHFVDLRDESLVDSRMSSFERWLPRAGGAME